MSGSSPGGGSRGGGPGVPAPTGPLDPGLQSERTGLAWARTALALAANAALIVRSGIIDHAPGLTLAGVGLAMIAAVVGMLGWRRHHQIVEALLDGRSPVGVRTIQIPAVGTLAAAVVVVLTIVR